MIAELRVAGRPPQRSYVFTSQSQNLNTFQHLYVICDSKASKLYKT
ncbi:hypothetical protein L798_11447 [Zootermopsis nevadensis]|uniref:Uncharacterized protein n=1 Tax=Zootermopsis nevadensis TaxID=136037 RepID=A0A067R387_ZOONE|nr:hypothetical protein L798_11447 [Zootermopsis nevadensis]